MLRSDGQVCTLVAICVWMILVENIYCSLPDTHGCVAKGSPILTNALPDSWEGVQVFDGADSAVPT